MRNLGKSRVKEEVCEDSLHKELFSLSHKAVQCCQKLYSLDTHLSTNEPLTLDYSLEAEIESILMVDQWFVLEPLASVHDSPLRT